MKIRSTIGCAAVVGLGAGLLSACSQRLNGDDIAVKIQTELGQRENLPVQTVTCPKAIALAPQSTFQCTGELESGAPFVVEVTQTERPEDVQWKVPNSKGILNLGDLEKHFQTTIGAETAAVPVVNCGDNYRLNRAGDRFECRVLNGILSDQTRVEKVVVTIDAEQNVSWQQVRQPLVAAQPAIAPQPPTQSATGVNGNTTPEPKPKLGIDIGD